jgi:hypothetical protein
MMSLSFSSIQPQFCGKELPSLVAGFRTPDLLPPLRQGVSAGQFWGVNTDRILQPLLRKVVLSQKVDMLPRYRGTMGQCFQKRFATRESKKSLEIYQNSHWRG